MSEKSRNILRAMVGAYLAYLGYTLLRGIFVGTADSTMVSGVFGVLFLLVGVGFIVWCIVRVKNSSGEPRDEKEDGEDA